MLPGKGASAGALPFDGVGEEAVLTGDTFGVRAAELFFWGEGTGVASEAERL